MFSTVAALRHRPTAVVVAAVSSSPKSARGFKCPGSGLWRIPLVDMVRNNNTETVIVNQPLTEFLPERPPPIDAIHNVYELKTQPELVRYSQSQCGLKQSRTTNMHRGQVSQRMSLPGTIWT